ncbi:MAG: response regulator transcription factor [Chthoniobacteraceae bacterium]
MVRKKKEPAKTVRKRLVVIDDHGLIRRGLISMINNEPDLEVCAEADTLQGGLKALTSAQPDMATVDLHLGDCDGLELIKDIRKRLPSLPVLVISMHDEAVYAERAFRAGARGYVTKQQASETVLAAIRRVLAGGRYMSPAMQERFAQHYAGGHTHIKESPVASLSDREIEVFRLIGEGKVNRQMAEQLTLSVKTIETYREHLKSKLNLQTSGALARSAALWVSTGNIG